MGISFTSGPRRWLFLAGVALIAACLTAGALQRWQAETWLSSSEPQAWQRAAWLEPDNADHWFRLAQYYQWDWARGDLTQAIRFYRRATELNPHATAYWLELAGAYESAGERERAREVLVNAQATFPHSPDVAWRYGNFLLRQGELPEAFEEIRRALALDRSLTAAAVALCWQATRDVNRLLEDVLPPDSQVYLQTIQFLVAQEQLEAALAVWERLSALHASLELGQSLPLAEALLQRDRIEEARDVWRQALAAAGWVGSETAEESLITDPGFEREFPNGGFGWRQQSVAGASFDFDTATVHSGRRALRVTFDGTANLDFQHLAQYVAVQPRRRYRFAAFLRSDGVSTDSGVRFRVFDPDRPAALDLLTPALTGTQPWVRQELEFTTGPDTRLVTIALRRLPSRKLDNKIRGTVWVDDVTLTPVEETRGRQPQ